MYYNRKQHFTCQVLAIYTLTLVFIFFILFSLHFPRYWKGELFWQSGTSLIGDHFLYFHDLYTNSPRLQEAFLSEDFWKKKKKRINFQDLFWVYFWYSSSFINYRKTFVLFHNFQLKAQHKNYIIRYPRKHNRLGKQCMRLFKVFLSILQNT